MTELQIDIITKVEIDNSGKLYLTPEKTKFPLIYRTATEVHWDNIKKTLYSPKPREWRYLDWFMHIIVVIKTECQTELLLSDETEWINIPKELKIEITKAQQCV